MICVQVAGPAGHSGDPAVKRVTKESEFATDPVSLPTKVVSTRWRTPRYARSSHVHRAGSGPRGQSGGRVVQVVVKEAG